MESLYLGIDLGTSNSAACVFDGQTAAPVLTPSGEPHLPSVVRVTEQSVSVGARAKKHQHKDARNVFKEFKRLMGTDHLVSDGYAHQWSPEALSSEVLKALKQMSETQYSCVFQNVVITVPALFELPQSRATSEAARMAGFERVELLPEPVASALASGWSADYAGKAWLVYDLGGGTFDVSLLETRDGLLRVVAHDGDNFLGGRDLDQLIVQWMREKLAELGITIQEESSEYVQLRRHLEMAAEQAKIQLSTQLNTVIELDFTWQNEIYELDLRIDRQTLEALSAPIIEKTISICQKLLSSQGLTTEHLANVVIVGGPGHMPIIRNRVAQALAPIAESDADPMTIVAEGAAIYAATLGLPAASEQVSESLSQTPTAKWWLQFPTICSELSPSVMGRLVGECDAAPTHVRIISASRNWQTDQVTLEGQMFFADVTVLPSQKNTFELRCFDRQGEELIALRHEFSIVHGITISDPPLSRTIGISLMDGTVKPFIQRGTALPAKRSFSQSVVDTLIPGSGQSLVIPIVQGDRRQARFCRKVGQLELHGDQLKSPLNSGSSIEITIEVDRGGDLKAQAHLPSHNILVDGLAKLVMSAPTPDAVKTLWFNLQQRLTDLQRSAFRSKDDKALSVLTAIGEQMARVQGNVEKTAMDLDDCQRVSKTLLELEADIEEQENIGQLEGLIEECEITYLNTKRMVEEFGDAVEKNMLELAAKQLHDAVQQRRLTEIERLIEKFESIYRAAHRRSPDFWYEVFEYWASRRHMSSNPAEAERIVQRGRDAAQEKDTRKLEQATLALFDLMPNSEKRSSESYDSGVF